MKTEPIKFPTDEEREAILGPIKAWERLNRKEYLIQKLVPAIHVALVHSFADRRVNRNGLPSEKTLFAAQARQRLVDEAFSAAEVLADEMVRRNLEMAAKRPERPKG